MLGSENYTEPVQLDPHAMQRWAVSVSVNDRGIAKTVKLTQDGQSIILTPAEITALMGYAA